MKQAHIKMKVHVTYGETKNVVEESLVENTVGRLFQEKEYIIVFKSTFLVYIHGLFKHPIILRCLICPRTLEGGTHEPELKL